MAFSSRLAMAWRSRNGSPATTSGPGGASSRSATPRWRARGSSSAHSWASSSPNRTGSRVSSRCLCSTSASASSLRIMVSSRPDCARMLATKRSRSVAGMSSCSSSAAPPIAASGLFISCVSVWM
ncbi:hypothetical protein D9M69_692350 [compost metagenome]